MEVIGVAEVIKYNNPGEDAQPYAYLPLEQYYVTNMNVVARSSSDPSLLLLAAESELRRMDPDMVVNTNTAKMLVSNALVGQRGTAIFLSLLGLVALVLAAIGIYGVMSYSVRRRRREIGIRLALGAERSRVLSMVLGQGLALAGVGLVLGAVVALGVTRLMSQLLFVDPADPIAFGGTLAVLFTVALAACLAPAWRASMVSPTTVLRYE